MDMEALEGQKWTAEELTFLIRITGILFLLILWIQPVMQSKTKNQDSVTIYSNLKYKL